MFAGSKLILLVSSCRGSSIKAKAEIVTKISIVLIWQVAVERLINISFYYPTCYIQSNEIVLTIWINCSLIGTRRTHIHETSLI